MKMLSALLAALLLALGASFAPVALSQNDDFDYDYEYFDTDNWAYDDYGYYDEDFYWETNDGWYDDWNEVDYDTWDQTETGHWSLFGYDDAGEWGMWDW